MSSKNAVARLSYHQGGKERSYELAKPTTLIGRDSTCDLQLTGDPFISRQHAEIQVKSDGIYIVDLRSRNGVFIIATRWENSEPDTPYFRVGNNLFKKMVRGEEKLENDDIVLIGNTELRVKI